MNHSLNLETLESGIKLLIIDTPNAARIDISVSLNAGYRFASKDASVVSVETPHILEHILFDGSRTYPEADDLQDVFTQGDGDWNGVTSPYHVHYLFRNKARYGLEVLKAALDMVYFPKLAESSYDEELTVVFNETKDSMNDFTTNAGLTMINQALPGLNLRSDEMLQQLRIASYDEVKAYHKKYYTTRNTTITITCDLTKVSADAIKQTIHEVTKDAPKGKLCALPKLSLVPSNGDVASEQIGKSIDETYISLGYTTEGGPTTETMIKAMLFGRMVTSMKSYSVQYRLRKQGLAYGMSFDHTASLETKGFELEVQTNTLLVDELLSQTLLMIKEMADNGIDEQAFQSLKRDIEESYEDELEPNEVSGWYFYDFLIHGRLATPDMYRAELLRITQDDVLAYAQSIITEQNQYAAVFSRKPLKDALRIGTITRSALSGIQPADEQRSIASLIDAYYIATPQSTRFQRVFIFINKRPILAWGCVAVAYLIGLALIAAPFAFELQGFWPVLCIIAGIYFLVDATVNTVVHAKRSRDTR